MTQGELLEQEIIRNDRFDLGRGYSLHLPSGPCRQGDLYHHDRFSKRVNLADKAEKRVFIVEMLQKNINQTRLAEVLNLSRQTLHNYRESYRAFGVTGLLHGYSPNVSINKELQGRLHVEKRRPGSKARELEAMRAQQAQAQEVTQEELAWDGDVAAIYVLEEQAIEEVLRIEPPAFLAMPDEEQPVPLAMPDEKPSVPLAIPIEEPPVPLAIPVPDEEPPVPLTIAIPNEGLSAPHASASKPPPEPVAAQVIELPYAKNHGWIASRYAGTFPILMVLICQLRWMQRLYRLFGNGWRIFFVFVFMTVHNIRSIEQLKHARREEAGRMLGLERLPGVDTLMGWFHDVAGKYRSERLLKEFFADQIRCGLVGVRLWFTDGHLLPYTGQNKVHAAWNTQRRMPMPGQTNMVTSDEWGRVAFFEIQEGHGDLRARILKLGDIAREQSLKTMPVQVFDREGDGLEFFSDMVRSGTPFITWEKNADKVRLAALQATDFTHSVQVNGTDYRLLEQVKPCVWQPKADPDTGVVTPSHHFNLRRVVLWNLRTQHRMSVLCWDGDIKMSTEMVATAMLSRWGASENTFKHLQERHPYHYHPGFGVRESEKQDIANPQIKVLATQIAKAGKHLDKLYKRHAQTKPVLNQDGSERINSRHRRLADAIVIAEAGLKQLKSDKAKLPERVDVAGLTDYRSFKAIDNEGKNLFDFVTTSVWNARSRLLDLLQDCYAKDNERVDLLYAIFDCQGWIYSDDKWVVVRLEPLQQPARRYAQEQLCRKLTGLGARIPGGKWLRVETGESPL